MNLVIDAGNTGLKAALFEKGEMLKTWDFARSESANFIADLQRVQPDATLIAAVAPIPADILSFVETTTHCFYLSENTALPIKNGYSTPLTLGSDRLANAVAAFSIYPNENVLVIDAGTCLKFDFVSADGTYLGGAISPGLNMRFKALHTFTDRLPLVEPSEHCEFIGRDTTTSILAGVMWGMKAEMEAMLSYYEKEFTNINCILTGGDQRFFLNLPKNGIFALPYLTLKGLDVILRYNQ